MFCQCHCYHFNSIRNSLAICFRTGLVLYGLDFSIRGKGCSYGTPVISGGRFLMRKRRVPIPAILSRTEEISPDARLHRVVPFVVCSMSIT